MNTASATSATSTDESTRSVALEATTTESPQGMQWRGKVMVVAGWVVTVVAAIVYCGACFSSGVDADLVEVLTTNAIPVARAALAATGVGTLLWLVGSFVYLRGAMDADPTEQIRDSR